MRFYDIGESPLMGLTEKCIAPLDGWQVLTSAGAWSYQSMKVRPQQLNSIFVPLVVS